MKAKKRRLAEARKARKAEYRRCFPDGDRLGRIASLIDWEAFRPILEPLFKNSGEGRPHIDVVLMTKVLVLQAWYGLADESLERECMDRLTFQNFLGYPAKVPDSRTVWFFRERLAKEKEKEKEFWDELQRQLKRYSVAVKKGQMKDAVFIELGGWRMEGREGPVVEMAPHSGYAQDSTIIGADPDPPTEEDVKRRREKEEKERRRKARKKEAGGVNPASSSSSVPAEPETKEAGRPQTSNSASLAATPAVSTTTTTTTTTTVKTKERGKDAKTTRSRDGTWTKKHGRSFFGYKLHTKDDLASGFIKEIEVTTASVSDGNVDLTKKGEVCVRDRGYPQGGRGSCVSMIKATRGHPLTMEDKELNKFLAKVRAPVEHPYSVIKRIFHAGRVLVTTVDRVKVRMIFVCTSYNLFRALTLVMAKRR